jgi:hypothetical protein
MRSYFNRIIKNKYFGKKYYLILNGQKVNNTSLFGCIYSLYSPPKYIYKGVAYNAFKVNLMTQLLDLQDQIETINILVRDQIISEYPDVFPITDGVIDVGKYIETKFKILWILNEPYDDFYEGKPTGGGWDLCKVISEKSNIYDIKGGRKTFLPMIYTSWGILNNFCRWIDMENIEDDPTMLEALKSIALINIKKTPGFKTSDKKIIKESYFQNKEILLKQLNIINPDIIIGNSHLDYFLNDMGVKPNNLKNWGILKYLLFNKKIFIKTYHPGQRSSITGISIPCYCDNIISLIEHFSNYLKS